MKNPQIIEIKLKKNEKEVEINGKIYIEITKENGVKYLRDDYIR